jgi:hypothetical protein
MLFICCRSEEFEKKLKNEVEAVWQFNPGKQNLMCFSLTTNSENSMNFLLFFRNQIFQNFTKEQQKATIYKIEFQKKKKYKNSIISRNSKLRQVVEPVMYLKRIIFCQFVKNKVFFQ